MLTPDLSTHEGREQLRALASRATNDGYTGNDDYGHLTVSPAVLTALLEALDAAEAATDRVQRLIDQADRAGEHSLTVTQVQNAVWGGRA